MTQVSAHYTRNHFAEIIDMSQREPVEIAKHGRIVSILMSKNEYDLMRHIMDEWWMSAAHTDVSTGSKEDQLKKLQRSLKNAKAGRGVKRDLLS
jgi:prevent-host-death family protein